MRATVVMTVLGARPQFIKAAPVSRALRRAGLAEVLVHTGQHYDSDMSDVFLDRLGVPAPAHHLQVGSATHGVQTARMLERLEAVMAAERPVLVLVYGDTNSTVAGALAAVKLQIPVGHVEAGLRSFDRRMPEEANRVVTDHVSEVLFAPTESAVRNLAREGLSARTVHCGDVMLDAARLFERECTDMAADVRRRFGVSPGSYAIATVHRQENTDEPARWHGILEALSRIASEIMPVIWPVHPRARKILNGRRLNGVLLLDPLPYAEMQALVMGARVVLTDSGGLQKEAAFHNVPCVTLRDETEWVELVASGVNCLAGTDADRVVALAVGARWPEGVAPRALFGDGKSADLIAQTIVQLLETRALEAV